MSVQPYAPPDVDKQHELWGANCGPTALAALLGKTVAEIRPLVQPFKGFMHAGDLVTALGRAGKQTRRHDEPRGSKALPQHGLAVLQIDGPWCEPGVNPKARFRYTHTIACWHGVMVYDGNMDKWRRRENWERETMAFLVQDQKRATGWYTSTIIEVIQ